MIIPRAIALDGIGYNPMAMASIGFFARIIEVAIEYARKFTILKRDKIIRLRG